MVLITLWISLLSTFRTLWTHAVCDIHATDRARLIYTSSLINHLVGTAGR
jgi:hypothetical protein